MWDGILGSALYGALAGAVIGAGVGVIVELRRIRRRKKDKSGADKPPAKQ